MKQVEILANIIAVASATATITVLQRLLLSMDASVGVQVLVAVLVVGVCLTFLREFVLRRVLSWRALRRAVMGDDYVEGTWVDVVVYANQPARIGIVEFKSSGSALRYSGENFDSGGQSIGSFATDVLSVNMPRLIFIYGEHRVDSTNSKLNGMGQIQFTETHGPPTRFHGYCIDADGGDRHAIVGTRVNEVDSLVLLQDPKTRGNEAIRIAQRLKPWSTLGDSLRP